MPSDCNRSVLPLPQSYKVLVINWIKSSNPIAETNTTILYVFHGSHSTSFSEHFIHIGVLRLFTQAKLTFMHLYITRFLAEYEWVQYCCIFEWW